MTLTLQYEVRKQDAEKTLRNFLHGHNISRKAITALKHRGGKTLVNGEAFKMYQALQTGDIVVIIFPPEEVSESLVLEPMQLEIEYEDEYLLVINKPAGIPVIPSRAHPRGTLAGGIMYYYKQFGIMSTVHFVNRLDKKTSGLLIVAKYRHIHHLLTKDIKHIQRKYYALVSGVPSAASATIQAPIARAKEGQIGRCVHPDGKRAITHYETIRKVDGNALVRCELETGRTHQIRVHMAHIGCPLIGDNLYGEGNIMESMMLHSYHVAFTHPTTQEFLTFASGIPERFNLA